LIGLAACADRPGADALTAATATTAATPTIAATTTTGQTLNEQFAANSTVPVASDPAITRPPWLGQRPLPTTPDGRVITPQTTPEELRDRRLPTIDTLPAPPDDRFQSSLGPVPDEVLARSTWTEGCPVSPDELAYLTMSFWGFDGAAHTGEMVVHRDQAENVVAVFEKLHRARYPIEEMRVVAPADLVALPTGDGNNTTGFVCRPVTGGSRFSEHAYGLAIDVNPFLNPYIRGDLLLPELAGHYLDRDTPRPGVVTGGDVVVEAFASIGWGWGGEWRSLKDYQHFALNNR
jgi:hypothetical protein